MIGKDNKSTKRKNSEKHQKIVQRSTKSTKSTKNGGYREYPELDIDVEIALVSYAKGEKISDIAVKLNKHRSTIWNWFQLPEVATCLQIERNKIYQQARDSTPSLVSSAYELMHSKLKSGEMSFKEAMTYLEKTGYLQTTQDKAEENKRIAQLADQLYAEIQELKSMNMDTDE